MSHSVMKTPRCNRICSRFLVAVLSSFACLISTAALAYDPLAVAGGTTPQVIDLYVHDNGRERDIPLRVYLSQDTTASPLILFSPGLGGSRSGYAYLAKHWAARGFAVVVLQHPGSDDSVWKDKSRTRAIAAMHSAASAQNFLLRIKDVKVVLDYLSEENQTDGNPLTGKLDLTNIGMAGHSFGAVTTEAVSGERFRGRTMFTDPRIKAALLMSPSSPRHGTAAAAFGQVSIPWLLMTGTQDIGLLGLGAQDIANRLAVYKALPPGHKYELILADAQHMAFTDRSLSPSEKTRNPNDHRAILAISTAFWDAMLHHRADAQTWLDTAAHSVLKPGDQWQQK
jgi:predicted dienelactone hydrolase